MIFDRFRVSLRLPGLDKAYIGFLVDVFTFFYIFKGFNVQRRDTNFKTAMKNILCRTPFCVSRCFCVE